MSVPVSRFADVAADHIGEDGPLNTCWSNGPERWARELGLPGLNTASVGQAEQSARAGVNGWRYHEGTAGLSRGHVADWSDEHLGGSGKRHVCVVDDVDGDRWRGIGSGTPSGKVARQPASGGWNPKRVLVGYFIPPSATSAMPSKPKPAADDRDEVVYVVKRGDYLQRIARQHDTSVPAILRANPPRRDGRSTDFHIARANHIEVGQKIRIP